jgi:hypothetical protein
MLIGMRVAHAQTSAFSTNITFTEPAFPTATTTMAAPGASNSVTYNVINDLTGAELTTLNGDVPDLLFAFSNSNTGALSSSGRPNSEWNNTSFTGRFMNSEGYTGAVSSNNPGTRTWNKIRVTFDSHLAVTSLTARFSSLNTAGVAWEFSKIAFLQPDGSYFSSEPLVGDYNSFGGTTGNAALGWFLAADKATVSGVGSATTAGGTAGTADASNFAIGYTQTGLTSGTQIGGFEFITYLDDVRGTGTGSTNFTSSLVDFDFSGTTTVPEPGTLWLFFFGIGVLGLRYTTKLCNQSRVSISLPTRSY